MKVEFVVYGEPAPQGSKEFKGMFTGHDGRPHAKLAESSKKVKPWRQDVAAAAMRARGIGPNGEFLATSCPVPLVPMDGPLRGRMVFTMRKPASAPKRKRTYPCTKPDVSKLVRSTEDALVTAGLIKDDARIVEYTRIAKVYTGEDEESLEATGVRITIETID